MNNAGRTMMLKDFSSVLRGFESIMDPRCNEKKEFCENYIRIWFSALEELLSFINENKVNFESSKS